MTAGASMPVITRSRPPQRRRVSISFGRQEVLPSGDWEGWTSFFLDGVASIADEAVASARELFTLVTEDRTRALDHTGTSVAAVRLFELLPRYPVVSVAVAMKQLGVSRPTAEPVINPPAAGLSNQA